MFGKEYRNHLDILTQSFGQMNKEYEAKVKKNNRSTPILVWIKKAYIRLFGIPEIGFQIRSLYFQKIINNFIEEKNLKKILDAGSGIGAYTFWLAERYTRAKVTGGDTDKYKLKTSKIIRDELHIKNVDFIYLNVTANQRTKKYDLIVTVDVLEHIINYFNVIKNFSKMLNKNGYLYIHVPQTNQKRIFSIFKNWHHEDHVREGVNKVDLKRQLKILNFKIIVSKETFGFFGKLAWEINHLMLSKSFFIAGITYPLLYVVAKIDLLSNNHDGLGIAVLAKKE